MKKLLLALTLTVLTLTACSKNHVTTQTATPTPSVQDTALKNALNLYAQAKASGQDLSNGPCLGQVAPDWVADLVHNPRQKVDDDPKNQCSDYLSGKVHHFIELDLDGKLVRIN